MTTIEQLRAMVDAPVTRRTVVIYPDYYDDIDDHGYGWVGEASDDDDAVAKACAQCDADNDREEGTLDPGEIAWTDAHPDYQAMYDALVKAIRS
jgi:hypothetical protein